MSEIAASSQLLPTLQDICCDKLIELITHKSDLSILETYSFSRLCNLHKLYMYCKSHIRDRYAFYLDKFGCDVLREYLGSDMDAMQAMHDERIKVELFLSRKV